MLLHFNKGAAPDRHEVQYFEMFGNRGIYYGWSAVTSAAHHGGSSDKRWWLSTMIIWEYGWQQGLVASARPVD